MNYIQASRTTFFASMIAFIPTYLFASTVADASGDSTSHDIATASAVYNSTHMLMSATFFPGTLDSNNLGFIFGFDLDQNSATGTQPPSSFPLGADRTVTFNSLNNATNARIFTGSSFVFAPVAFGVDSLSLSLPLSAFGDDGAAFFGLAAGDPVSSSSFAIRDFAPDSALGNPMNTPTTVIPEPCSIALVSTCFLMLLGFRTIPGNRRPKHSN